jgi:hypothetical protein
MDRDTSEYSSTQAPETQEQAQEHDDGVDARLVPGGAQPRTPFAQGMPALDADTAATAGEPGDPPVGARGKAEITGE